MKLYSKEVKALVNNDIVSEADQLHLFNLNKKNGNGKLAKINDNEYRPIKALGHTPPYKIHKYFFLGCNLF